MPAKTHDPVPRFARPSEGGEGLVCKECGKPVHLKDEKAGKEGGYAHTTASAEAEKD